jgi:dihydroorotate dehydrogenase electron transfer subunit
MVWLPGVDGIPMSLSSTHPRGVASVTVSMVGEATRLLHQKKEAELIGIRGPFGTHFRPVDGKALLVGGGTGIAPLAFLAEELRGLKTDMTFLLGAKTREELLFLPRIEKLLAESETKLIASTEDGSYGHKGMVTQLAEAALAKEQFDVIYACGKEPMLFKIFTLAEQYRVPMQASLERLMRCAIGLCGSCTIGKYRVCIDGPVFTSEQLREVKGELGRFKRDFDGRKIPL